MIPRIGAEEAHRHLTEDDALLVCAYTSDEKFHANHVEGAISLQKLEAIDDRLPADQEIIFYCG